MQEQKMTPGGQPHDPYSHIAIPGQSLTKPKGEYAWEQPPTHTTPDSAIAELLDQLSVPENMARLFTLLENDITVVAIVDAIVLSGFAIGKYNPNVAELIKPDLREFIMMLADKADIKYREGVVKQRTDFDDALEEYKSDMVFHKCEDKTVNNLMRKFSDRAISSNEKHGDKIHEVNKSNIQWVTEALEECMDMCVYLERLL